MDDKAAIELKNTNINENNFDKIENLHGPDQGNKRKRTEKD